MANRFRVFKTDCFGFREIVHTDRTTDGCFQFLSKQDTGLSSFLVDDVIDDIEVDADEFIQAFIEGECPGDLQFF